MVKDWSYLAAFKRKDLPSLKSMAEYIRKSHDTDMIQNINGRFEDKAKTLDNGIEIVDVTKTEDLVLYSGLNQCIALLLGTGTARFRYMGIGNASTAATLTDTGMGAEFLPRVDMTEQGWTEAQGMKLFYGAIMGSSPALSPVRECGVFTNSTSGQMLNHEVFANNPLTRSTHTVVFILSTVVEFCPVAD